MNQLDEALAVIDMKEELWAQNEMMSPAQELPENTEMFRVYVVEAGDYLEKICEKNSLDYTENIGKIMKINGIENVDKIYAGQELYLPIDE